MDNLGNFTQEEISRVIQIRNGEYLSSLRLERNLTLKAVASQLAISFQYLSEIEKGNKSPSDQLLHELAFVFGLDIKREIDLFHRYDRVPLLTMKEIKDQDSIHFAFAQLHHLVISGKISQEQRQEFYAKFETFFNDFISQIIK
jgi:transcriptional regulator with XRE-family HTH domain